MSDPPAHPPAPLPGLQAERTALAWQRTGIAGAALAASATVAAAHLASSRVFVTVTVLAVLCAAAVAVAGGSTRAGSPWPRLVAVATIPVLLAAAGVALSLSP